MTESDIKRTIRTKGYCVVGDYAIEKIFTYRDYKCVIAFMSMGHRCGYVGLPKTNKFYGKDYDDIPAWCHGGLTYSGKDYPLKDDLWYIGFDCIHLGDKYDFPTLMTYFADNKTVMESAKLRMALDDMSGRTETVRDKIFVYKELRGIVDQLCDDGKE